MIFAYYMTYNLERPGELSFVLGTLLIAEVISVPLASAFAKKQSKAKAIIFGNVGWICCAVSSSLITKDSPEFAIYMLAAVLGFFIAFSLIGFTAMFGDVTEVGEYFFGRRVEGSFTGIQQFIRKFAAALANWVALMLLGLSGFINPVENIEGGVTTIINQAQSDTTLFTIKGILAFSSIILLTPAIITAARWKLNQDRHSKLIRYLDRKRSGVEVGAEEEAEIEGILKPLI